MSEKHLPGLGGAFDRIVFDGDDTAWVPERTCMNVAEPDAVNDRPFTCSECGARGPYGNGTYHIGGTTEFCGSLVFFDSWPVWRYCPNCGAKVVDE